jgi:hypothetical protein
MRKQDRHREKAARAILEAARCKLQRFRYVYPEVDRRGKLRVYFKMKGKRKVPIRPEPGSTEFLRVYADLLDGRCAETTARQPSARPVPKLIESRTLAWLFNRYMASDDFRRLGKSTKQVRRNILNAICEVPHPDHPDVKFGSCPVDRFGTAGVKLLRSHKIVWKVEEHDGELVEVMTNKEGANSWVKALRAVLAWAVEENDTGVEYIWARDVPLYPGRVDGIHTWSLSEIAQYRASRRWNHRSPGPRTAAADSAAARRHRSLRAAMAEDG